MSNMEIDETDDDSVMEYDAEDYSIICHLPNDILLIIFAFLPLDDRKSVRLVSRFWYRLSTMPLFTMNEKFVFRSTSHMEDIVKVMLQLNFTLVNLEFQGLPTISLPVKFWRECGSRIDSLGLFQCAGDDRMIKNIFIHCENLTSFTYKNFDYNLSKEILHSSKVLDELIEKGIQRTKLHTFDVCIRSSLYDAEIILDKIFLVYPGIRCFSAEYISESSSFSCLPISLDSLTLVFWEPYERYFKICFTIAELGLRLKCFKVMMPVDCTSHFVNEGLFKFFSSQKDLEVIYLLLERECMCSNCRIINKIIFQIFKSCPNLQKLSVPFSTADQLYFNLKELSRFLSSISKLQYLEIAFDIIDRPNIDWPNASKTLYLPQNFLLTTLALSEISYQEIDHIYAVLFPRCTLLRHLKLRVNSDRILQTIFKYLLKLETLVISFIEDCSHYGFSGDNAPTGEGYSIKRLQQLKRIHIVGLYNIESVEKILLEFQLPRLEFLNLNDVTLGLIPLVVWGQILSQVPELRELSLHFFGEDYSDICMETFIQFCKHLKKIHHLCIDDALEESDNHDILPLIIDRIEEIFYACPSLRYLRQGQYNVFSFDPLTKKVLKVKNLFNFKFSRDIFDENTAFEQYLPYHP